MWVKKVRNGHIKNNKIREDRKDLLEKKNLGFAWTLEDPQYYSRSSKNDKLWHQQHEYLVEFKRKPAFEHVIRFT
jgi:hypothetical protein